MKALILVDIQNDFVTGGALAVPEGETIIPTINQLQAHFDLIIATKDWHPDHHGSFAANHSDKQPGQLIDLNGLQQVLWPIHCVQDTEGAEFVETLDTDNLDMIFVKGTDHTIDSYSGFFDNGHRKSTGLDVYLKEQQVKEVYVVGLATDYCVKFTALDALELGFTTYLIEDASKGVNLAPEDVAKAIEEMRTKGVHIIHSNHFLNIV